MVSSRGVISAYVHLMDPVALPLFQGMAIRWYGLAYLAGFVAGFFLLRFLAQRKLWVLPPEKTGDFIAASALFGVFLGGRLGYVLFYTLPRDGWQALIEDPFLVLRVWEGGMSSHGGILGLVIFTWFYARKHRVSWTGLGDGLCVVAPVGILCGRLANFVNGELFGRAAQGVAWAMKFPESLSQESEATQMAVWQASIAAEPSLANSNSHHALVEAARHNPEIVEVLNRYLTPRHPSQLYEALLEGLLLFVILWLVRIRFRQAPNGLLTGLFFALYAVFRIAAEQFREPDAAWVIEGIMTKGQFYSLFMFIFAAGFLVHAWRGGLRARAVPR